jgi:hypothetical protein
MFGCRLCLENIIHRGIGGPYGAFDSQHAELYGMLYNTVQVDRTI